MPKPTTRYLTTRAAADILGVTAPTVIKWVEGGRLDAHLTPGGHRRISIEEVERFASEQRVGPTGDRSFSRTDTGGTRVLVIDRDLDFAEMVAEYLQLQGDFRVGYACNPIEAGFQAGHLKPDFILYDVDAVGIDIYALKKLVENVQVLLVTSIWKPEVDAMQAELGALGVIEKPVKLDQIVEVIQIG